MAEGKAEGSEQAAGSGASVFVSYSHKNRDLKLRVETALRAAGFETRSDEDIVEGTDYRSDIARLIRSSTLTVVLWTHEAFSTRWVADEAHLADELANRDGRLRYIGVIIDPVLDRLPFPLTNRQNLNLSQDGLSPEGMQRLVAVVARFAALQGMAPPAPSPAPADLLSEAVDEAAQELEFYTAALQAGTIPALRSYLTHYPKGAHRTDAEARLAALTSPVQRWRKRMIGGGAAIAGALTLLFTGYPVLKELTTSPNSVIERAAEEAPELAAAALAPEPDAPEPAPTAEPPPAPVPAPEAEPTAAPTPPAPAAADVGPVTPPPMLALATLSAPAPETDVIPPSPGTPVSPATLSTLAPPADKADPWSAPDTASFDLDLSPLIEACDLAAGSFAYHRELAELGRPTVFEQDINPDSAIPACAAAYAAAPLTPRIRHAFATSLRAGAEAEPALMAEAVAVFEENCWNAGKAGAPSCIALGVIHEVGYGAMPVDLGQAVSSYARACDLDDAWGCNTVALLLRENGPQKDLRLAASLAKRGCGIDGDGSQAKSCNTLGLLYETGWEGTPSDLVRALTFFQQACDLQYAWGCENAAYHLRHDSVQRDLSRAAGLAEKGCEMKWTDGIAESCNTLGLLYETGWAGTPADLGEAVTFFQKACDFEYAWGCANAAEVLWQDGPYKDLKRALELVEKGCGSVGEGKAESCNRLGLFFKAGWEGTPADLGQALTYFRNSCYLKYAWGCANAAETLRLDSPHKDLASAAWHAERGCGMEGAEGRAESCNTLGIMRGSGEMRVGPDIAGAITAFAQSCELGYGWGCANAAATLRLDGPHQDLTRAALFAEEGCGMQEAEGRAESCATLSSMRETDEIGAEP